MYACAGSVRRIADERRCSVVSPRVALRCGSAPCAYARVYVYADKRERRYPLVR